MQDRQQQSGISPQTLANLLVWLVTGWAMTIYVPLRRNMGKEQPGVAGLVGLVWLLAWIGFANAGPLILLVPLYLFSLICHRIQCAMRSRRGEFIHTFYTGESSLLMTLLRIKDENKAKGLVEPMLAFALGVYLLQFDPGTGGYFIGGALAMFGCQAMVTEQQQRQIDDMRNGMIENAHLMSNFSRQGRRRF